MTMKFRKGSRVEVLRSRERDKECWRTGEVIGGNGRFYIVRFDGFACCGGSPLVQGVRPGSVRPFPPVVKGSKFRRGDIVEVLVDFCWQSAKVSKVMRNRYVYVLTIGACEKIRVRKGDVRIKQSWLNDEWVADILIPHTFARGKSTSELNIMCKSEIMQTKAQNNPNCPDDKADAKKTNNKTHGARLKRKSLYGDNPEQYCEVTQKFRAIEKDGLVVRAPAVTQSPKAADSGTRYLSRETQEQPWSFSFWRKLWFSKVNAVKENPFDTDTTMTSVDSCSFTSHGIHIPRYHTHKPERSKENGGYVSDAESFCGRSSEDNSSIHFNEKTARVEVQRCKSVSMFGFGRPCDLLMKLIVVFAAYALLH